MEGLLSAMSGKKRSDRPTLPLSKTGKPDRNIVKNPPRHPKSEQLKPGSEGRLPGTPRLIGRREPRLPQCPQRPSDCAAHRGRLDSPPPTVGFHAAPGLCCLCIITLTPKGPRPFQHLLERTSPWSCSRRLTSPPPLLYSGPRWCRDLAKRLRSLALPSSAQGAITKYHRPAGLRSRHLFSHSSGSWVKMPANSVLGVTPLPGLQTAAFSPRPRMAIPLCMERKTLGCLFSSHKDTSPIESGPRLCGLISP